MKENACRILISGMVTGVGFRYYALRQAEHYADLRGYVRNLDDRTVECVLQGPETALEAMTASLRRGPPSARVTDFRISSLPVDPHQPYFHVAY